MDEKQREKFSKKNRFVRAVLRRFMAAHPKAFFGKDSPETVPLKIGIGTDLIAAHPDMTPSAIGSFLQVYTNKNRYHRAMVSKPNRLDLAGQPSGPVSDADRARADHQLAERASKPKAG